ncbi:kinase-like domain-containing protein [Mycena pura]|uniref:Kinase-like domain-containing protein n=1 Tax=Mycena pura TaxID=153505 RepID=A0AAD6UP21_9AGAR|nr:kinase-like domain-containing protein [Mycena pura]
MSTSQLSIAQYEHSRLQGFSSSSLLRSPHTSTGSSALDRAEHRVESNISPNISPPTGDQFQPHNNVFQPTTFRLTEVHERSPLGTTLLSPWPSPTLVHSPSPVKAPEALENIFTPLDPRGGVERRPISPTSSSTHSLCNTSGTALPSELGGLAQTSKSQLTGGNIQLEQLEGASSGEETFYGATSIPWIRGRALSGHIAHDHRSPWPIGGGVNSNIYRGKVVLPNGRRIRIAIKVIRVPDHGSDSPRAGELSKRLRREADIWTRLHHPNVLPFLGICDDERVAPHPVLISPFYKFGHVGNYVTKHPSADRDELIYGVTCGLQFLHANDIVHGGLKVQNVLVDKRGVPCICDFGISKILNCHGYTSLGVGTVPYMAPELFAAESVSTTKESDVFSWALLALEACGILTSAPLKGQQTTAFVTSQIGDALRPQRSDYDAQKVTDDHWAILERCWNFEPHQRPSIGDVLSWLPPSSHTRGV